VAGRLVRTLVDSEFEPGPHSVMWNARTDGGRSVASGVYLVRMESGDFVATSRLTLVR
jgi:flagellar hook assembly protein FlgD